MQAFELLEKEFGQWAGAQNVVGCASGSAALHLALESLQLPPGSEVIMSDYNMIAVPRAIVMAGLVPVFVDCGDDLLMQVPLLNHLFGDVRTADGSASAVIVTHIYGRAVSMCSVNETMVRVAPAIIEDLAEAHGVKPHPSTDAACWSFFKNKIVAGEEGGAVAFRSPEHAKFARSLRCLGFTPEHDYTHIPRGWNHRLSNAHAALIRSSLAVADANIFRRRQIEAMYEQHCPQAWRMPERAAPWVYDIRIPGMTHEIQDELVAGLKECGIAARHGFKPMSSQSEFRNCRVIGNGNVARIAPTVIYLPIQPGITTEASVERAFDIIDEIVRV